MTLFRRTHLPSPPPADAMPPRPPECRATDPAPRWHGAWRSGGALNPSYDPCGAPPSRTPETRRNA